MALITEIDEATGAGPTWAAVTAVKWNRVDTASGTTAIPTPTSTGTNFSYVKTFAMNITTTNSLTMTNLSFGKVASETTTGTKLWQVPAGSAHLTASGYTQATTAPGATSDNNVTAPTLNTVTASAVAINTISSPATVYDAGGFNATGRTTHLVEVALGVDSSNTTAGTTVACPTLRFVWTEGAIALIYVLPVVLILLAARGALLA